MSDSFNIEIPVTIPNTSIKIILSGKSNDTLFFIPFAIFVIISLLEISEFLFQLIFCMILSLQFDLTC